jgi:hypothetical protein
MLSSACAEHASLDDPDWVCEDSGKDP